MDIQIVNVGNLLYIQFPNGSLIKVQSRKKAEMIIEDITAGKKFYHKKDKTTYKLYSDRDLGAMSGDTYHIFRKEIEVYRFAETVIEPVIMPEPETVIEPVIMPEPETVIEPVIMPEPETVIEPVIMTDNLMVFGEIIDLNKEIEDEMETTEVDKPQVPTPNKIIPIKTYQSKRSRRRNRHRKIA